MRQTFLLMWRTEHCELTLLFENKFSKPRFIKIEVQKEDLKILLEITGNMEKRLLQQEVLHNQCMFVILPQTVAPAAFFPRTNVSLKFCKILNTRVMKKNGIMS